MCWLKPVRERGREKKALQKQQAGFYHSTGACQPASFQHCFSSSSLLVQKKEGCKGNEGGTSQRRAMTSAAQSSQKHVRWDFALQLLTKVHHAAQSQSSQLCKPPISTNTTVSPRPVPSSHPVPAIQSHITLSQLCGFLPWR